MNPRCFLDMDGVIADFVTGVCAAHGRENPYLRPESADIFAMERLWGITAEAFWRPTNNEAFWRNLPKTPEANDLVRLVETAFGLKNVAILTAPSKVGACITGKRKWIEKNFPRFTKQIIFCSHKAILAGEDAYLIDDRDRNLQEFAAAGGHAICVPRPWNWRHACSEDVLGAVALDLSKFLDAQANL